MPQSRKDIGFQCLGGLAPQLIKPAELLTWFQIGMSRNHLRTVKKSELDDFLFNEVELILAEKRTALSGLRTGIAVFALPLSVLSVLIATSKLYNFLQVLNLLVVLLVLNVALIALGIYLVMHFLGRIRHLDGLIREIKRKHSSIAEFLD